MDAERHISLPAAVSPRKFIGKPPNQMKSAILECDLM